MSQAFSFRAVLFDLDDTLLRNDMEGTFLQHYFALLTEYARPLFEPRELMAALLAATEAMQRNQDPKGLTNEEAFAAVFAPQLGQPWPALHAFFERFYQEYFPKLHVYAEAHPDARQAVQACLAAGCRVVIATNPLFPRLAIEHRLEWAGIGDLPFALVTSYENMHTAKPAPAYYAEITTQLGVAAAECLMVGNDLLLDIAPAKRAGMGTFLADWWLLNSDSAIQADRRGSLTDLIAWIQAK